MKLTIRQLRRLIKEELTHNVVATIHYGPHGKVVEINGRSFEVHELAAKRRPALKKFGDYGDANWDAQADAIEDSLFRQYHVTHVVYEDLFNDNQEHSVEEYRTLK